MSKHLKKKSKTHTSTWTAVTDPLYYLNCPHCKADIFLSTPSFIERLKRWARKIINK